MFNSPWLVATICLTLFPSPILAKEIGTPAQFSDQVSNTDTFMKIRLRGSLILNGDSRLAELSDLAWDEDEKRLYGITDRGWLLHFIPQFERGILKDIEVVYSTRLRDFKGIKLRGADRDAEGLTLEMGNNGIIGDSQLIISFERNHRIVKYNNIGQAQKLIKPAPLLAKSISKMSKNKGMEAITLHPKFGLLTGPERPSFRSSTNQLISSQNKKWRFKPLETAGSMVALESLDNGDLLMLERAYLSPFHPWIISIIRFNQEQLISNEKLKPEILAQFDSSKGWSTLNFEGLTHHKGHRFFMASDDNNKSYAPTQMIYFELIDKKQP